LPFQIVPEKTNEVNKKVDDEPNKEASRMFSEIKARRPRFATARYAVDEFLK
jgi:hypothetical protein